MTTWTGANQHHSEPQEYDGYPSQEAIDLVIDQIERLQSRADELIAQMQRAAETLNAEIEGASPARIKPLVAIREAGLLREVLCIIEELADHPEIINGTLEIVCNLSRSPELTDAAIRLTLGARLTEVQKHMPALRAHGRKRRARHGR